MSHPLSSIIDRALRRAEQEGAFEGLAGAGKPIPDLAEPKDAVLGRMLKEAHALPPAVLLQRQIAESWKRLKGITGEAERKAEMRKLADLQTRLAIEQEAYRKYG